MEKYIEEILLGISGTLVLSIIAAVRAFFQNIKRMNRRIDKLEADLKSNTKSDKQLQDLINIWVEEKLKS